MMKQALDVVFLFCDDSIKRDPPPFPTELYCSFSAVADKVAKDIISLLTNRESLYPSFPTLLISEIPLYVAPI